MDAYYYVSAQWNDPSRNYASRTVLAIGDRHWTVRNTAATTVTAYSDPSAPTLSLNGVGQGVMTPPSVTVGGIASTVAKTYVRDVTLPAASNTVTASRALSDGTTYTDTATWTYHDAAGFAAWQVVADGVAVHRTFGYSPVTKTTSNPFEYALANGLYDVKISAPAGGVNNLSLEGQTVAIDSNGSGGPLRPACRGTRPSEWQANCR